MPSFYLSEQEHRRALALVRRMELRPGGMEWSALLDALETDRPNASRKAPSVAAQLAPAIRTLYRPENDRREAVRNDENGWDTQRGIL